MGAKSVKEEVGLRERIADDGEIIECREGEREERREVEERELEGGNTRENR